MYSINGIPLDNPEYGWSLRSTSKPLVELTRQLQSVKVLGRPGVLSGLPSSIEPTTMTLVVRTSRAQLPQLLLLLTEGTYVHPSADSTLRATFELMSTSPVGEGDADEDIDLTAVIRLPGVYFRRTTYTVKQGPLGSAVEFASSAAENSGRVNDASIIVRGAFTTLQLQCAATGSWVTFTQAPPTGHYVRFNAATGRASVVPEGSGDQWTASGAGFSGYIEMDGPGGQFVIGPSLTAQPHLAKSVVTSSVTGLTGSEHEYIIRGRAAHVVA